MKSEKVTKSRQGEEKRRYDDACGLAHALELIGDRWALLVMRELLLGPRRFSELRVDLPGISANVLSQRLDELEARGLVNKRRLPPPASVQVYQATEWGLELETVVEALGRWAARSPHHLPALPISAVSLLLSLRTMIDPARARKLDARIGFRFGSNGYCARIRKGRIKLARTEPSDCELVFTAAPTALAAVIYGGAPLDSVAIDGDRALAERFVLLFPLPAKASGAACATH